MKADMSQKDMALHLIAEHSGLSSYELEKLAIENGFCGETIRRRTRELVLDSKVYKKVIDGQTHWYPVETKPIQLSLVGMGV